MSTAPQRERSDRPKATRGLQGRSHKSHFVWKFTVKMAGDTSATLILCEPAQSKMHMGISQEPFCAEIFRKMPDAPDTTSIEHRALTITVRTPQCGHTVWGKMLEVIGQPSRPVIAESDQAAVPMESTMGLWRFCL